MSEHQSGSPFESPKVDNPETVALEAKVQELAAKIRDEQDRALLECVREVLTETVAKELRPDRSRGYATALADTIIARARLLREEKRL